MQHKTILAMLSKRFALLLALLFIRLCCATPALSEIYIWQDARGQIHYTDNYEQIPLNYRDDAKVIKENQEVKEEKDEQISTTSLPPLPAPSSLPPAFFKAYERSKSQGALKLPAKAAPPGSRGTLQKELQILDDEIKENTRLKEDSEHELQELREKLHQEREKIATMGRAKRYNWPIYSSQEDVISNYEQMIAEKEAAINSYNTRLEALQEQRNDLQQSP